MAKKYSPIHPGAFLSELIAELNLTQARLAREIGVSPMRISHVVKGARPVTADIALRLGRYLGQSAQYWLNLQAGYDIKIAEKSVFNRLGSIHSLVYG